MVISCKIEQSLYENTLKCIQMELVENFKKVYTSSRNPYSVSKSNICIKCWNQISKKSFLFFR